MNRTDLQWLAEARLREAEALLNASEWSGAYYLAGYAVECALKACIAKMTGLHDFPDKEIANKCFSHKFPALLEVAKLDAQKEIDTKANVTLRDHWKVVNQWREAARYLPWTESAARDLVAAISHPTDGVLAWIKPRW